MRALKFVLTTCDNSDMKATKKEIKNDFNIELQKCREEWIVAVTVTAEAIIVAYQ